MGANQSHHAETQREKRARRKANSLSYQKYKVANNKDSNYNGRPRAHTVPKSSTKNTRSLVREDIAGEDKENLHYSERPEPIDGYGNTTDNGSMDTKTQIEYKEKKLSDEEKSNFDSKFKPFFDKVAGADQEIDAFELQMVLNSAFKKEMGGKEFSLEACRSMVAMVDRDRNGKLDYAEFREMWTTVMRYKATFVAYDKDKSGDMNAMELRDALSKLGFKLSTPVLSSLALRYANKKGQVSLDDFLQICCRVKSSFESYLSYQGKSFSLDDYIMSAVYT